jgi:hypothetical protein
VPASWNGEFGAVEHTFDDSWTATVPADLVEPGVEITVGVAAVGSSPALTATFSPAVGAPSAIKMNMFDVHYFGAGSGDYAEGWAAELAAKWPVVRSTFDFEMYWLKE